jgi:hypothetical protein
MARIAMAIASVALIGASGRAEDDAAPATPVEAIESRAASAAAEPTAEEISGWIDQLQHDSFVVRQAAADRLLAAGLIARESLTAVADGPEPESRAAARRLIALIDKADFSRRLAAFSADIDGKQGLTLPGWKEFSSLVGGDGESRALFVEMQRHEAALLARFFGEGMTAGEASWEARLARLSQWQTTPDSRRFSPALGSCATMLFLGTLAEAKVSDQSTAILASLVDRPPLQQALQGEARREAVRRLVVGWVLECPNRSEAALQQRLSLALTQKLREAVPLALRIAQSDPAFPTTMAYTRGLAISLIGRLGGRANADALEPLLEDSSVCWPPVQAGGPQGPARNVQIRDVALVVLLQMTDQNPVDYGYTQATRQQPQLYAIETLHLKNDAEREAAVAKWRVWKAAQQSTTAPAE